MPSFKNRSLAAVIVLASVILNTEDPTFSWGSDSRAQTTTEQSRKSSEDDTLLLQGELRVRYPALGAEQRSDEPEDSHLQSKSPGHGTKGEALLAKTSASKAHRTKGEKSSASASIEKQATSETLAGDQMTVSSASREDTGKAREKTGERPTDTDKAVSTASSSPQALTGIASASLEDTDHVQEQTHGSRTEAAKEKVASTASSTAQAASTSSHTSSHLSSMLEVALGTKASSKVAIVANYLKAREGSSPNPIILVAVLAFVVIGGLVTCFAVVELGGWRSASHNDSSDAKASQRGSARAGPGAFPTPHTSDHSGRGSSRGSFTHAALQQQRMQAEQQRMQRGGGMNAMGGPSPDPSPRPGSPLANLQSALYNHAPDCTPLEKLPLSKCTATPNPQDPRQQAINHSTPPALCPTLVLPACEARFAVPLHILAQIDDGEFDILGMSGSPLLRAAVRKSPTGKVLELMMAHAHSSPRAVVGPLVHGGLDICGPGGSFYGRLEPQASGTYAVTIEGSSHQVMCIDGDVSARRLTVTSHDCRPLASASIDDHFGDIEHLELRIHPGVDAVLVISCVLAVFILGSHSAPTASSA